MQVRPYVVTDEEAVYDVCLRTGAEGSDASHLVDDPRLLGDVWAGPYLALEPELAFVLEDPDGVAGYVVAALDTRRFEAACDRQWWPRVRGRVRPPSGEQATWTLDERLAHLVHHPPRSPAGLARDLPSHLHIDLLPRAQGRGMGTRLLRAELDALAAAGSPGVHLGVDPGNGRARRFYERTGFTVLPADPDVVWMGRALP